jgi:nitrogen fixation NifU-like protein
MEVLDTYTHVIKNTNAGCGDEAHIYIQYNGQTIENVGFQSFGCASCLAVTSYLCKCIFQKTLSCVKNVNRNLFEETFDELEPAQRHCLDMAEVLLSKIVLALDLMKGDE